MQKVTRKSIFFPDYVAKSVLEIKPAELKRAGVTHLVFDIDETVMPRNHNQLSQEYIEFLQSLEKAGFSLLIGSNSIRDFSSISKQLNAPVIRPSTFAFKPLKRYYKKVILATGTNKKQIAMVGDRIINDIAGANHAGLTTILVEPYIQKRGVLHRKYISKLRN